MALLPAASDHPPPAERHGPARVSCGDCLFAWYGATAAHGLSVLGHCPRCGGQLHFHDEPAVVPDPVARRPITGARREHALAGVEPAQVLGTPLSWAR